ncbi:hypothetical protein FKP32DRAFT_1579936 [Trametes sanguinea]|nr:hypothetical protein FKP32DRAFT_1579936 [Trametes sanguinea]
MRRNDKQSKFHPTTVATASQVRGFLPEEGRCCTAAEFCLDLNSTPGKPWNVSAAKVFVDDFLRVELYACRSRTKIMSMFTSHFRTIQRHAPASSTAAASSSTPSNESGNPGPTDADKLHSKQQRRYTLFQRRYKIALHHEKTRLHIPILQRLGVDGMSSDEEDIGAPYLRYRILRKPWRSEAVTSFLRVLDALHRWRRSRAAQGSIRGAPPRLRFMSTNVSENSRPVPGLPRNAYDDAWFNSRTAIQLEDLRANATAYNFTHHITILA